MTPERWQRITEVFHLARARDVAARAALLDEACAGDVALRADVEEMLAADGEAGRFGDRPVLAATDQAPCLEPGARFGLYRIDALIGSGGMGEVYRAHDGRLDRDVAIKLLSATTLRDPDARLRLLREARSAAALNHPHVCTIYEVGETDGHAYIAMELIDGNSLDQLIPAGGFPLEAILCYGPQIADALAHAHERGIVHRDLKPANVMVSKLGIAKVLDFGLAKVLPFAEQPHVDSTASRSVTGMVIGTPAYMSPEQVLGRPTDERSDIFSFGGVLHEMATGRRAFNGATPMEVLDAVLHAAPKPVSSIRRDLDAELSQVIEKALAKDASQRYQRMADLATELRRLKTPASGAWARAAAMTGAAAAVAAVMWVGMPADRVAPNVAPARASMGDVTAGKTRVAVLPLENLTQQPDDDWMASALSRLLTLPAERGNACADYMKLTALEGDPQPAPTLDVKFGASATAADEREKLERLVADPEVRRRLEVFRAGSKKASCQIMGAVFPWPEGDNPMRARVPLFPAILGHAELARFLALELERTGRRDEAVVWLQALVVAGWHLQQEPLLLANMVGIKMSAEAADTLAEVYQRGGDNDGAGRWRAFAGLTQWRRYEEYQDSLRQLVRADVLATDEGLERVAALVSSPALLRGTRAESILWVLMAHLFRPGHPGPRARQRELAERWQRMDDPALAAVARHFTRLLDLAPDARVRLAAKLRVDLDLPAPR